MSEPETKTASKSTPKPTNGNPRRNPNDFYKYTGMAVKMGVVIFVGVYGGRKLDEAMDNHTPWITILLSLVGVAAAIYFVISDTKR